MLIQKYKDARAGNGEFVVLEGVHSIKHALRFGADIVDIAVVDLKRVKDIMESVGAVKEARELAKRARALPKSEFEKLAKIPPHTGAIALSKKPREKQKLKDKIVFLENPNSLHNLGAVIRVLASRGIKNIFVSGEQNPWHSECIRTSAGLHFAMESVRQISLNNLLKFAKGSDRKIFAFDADGEDVFATEIPDNVILAFGTERSGLSKKIKENSEKIVSIPMQEGVSSLNLATAVAIGVYADIK